MLKVRIIPCLDIAGGRVVKGIQFNDLVDAGNAVEQAKFYDLAGADELVFLDITASFEDRDCIFNIVEQVASNIFMPLTVGGGIRSFDDIRKLLLAGADKIAINTAVINNPALVTLAANYIGSQSVVVAIDAKKQPSGNWMVYTHGGRVITGLDAIEWAVYVESLGAGEILLTSMDCDGTRGGFDLELLKKVTDLVNIPVIASGGAGSVEHLLSAVVDGHVSAVLAASIFHFGDYTIRQVKEYFRLQSVPIRLDYEDER